jgi:DNA-binding MarR family transcriptional regulator
MKKASRRAKERGEVLELETYLPYLFHLITAALSNRFLERLRPYGVTVQRWRVLMVVMNKGALNMNELIRLTLIPQSALSRLIDQMERDGLVVRRVSEADNRVVEVELTPHGHDTYWRLAGAAAEHAETIVIGLDQEERNELHSMLRRVLGNLQVEAFVKSPTADPVTVEDEDVAPRRLSSRRRNAR